jgi:hypothetical protein
VHGKRSGGAAGSGAQDHDEVASKENPHAYKGVGHLGYDDAANKLMLFWVDNMGGWAQQTATGWDGDTFVRLGEGALEGADLKHLGEMQMNGTWVTVQDEVCKPQAAARR